MTAEHWDAAYHQGATTRGWYQPRASDSVRLIQQCGIVATASILDVGAGASVLADDLLALGYVDITAMDQSPVGLAAARQRLGERAAQVTWVVADLLDWTPPRAYDVWHDRAVLHFLLTDDERDRYRRTLLAATEPGSDAIIGVFGPAGPQMCAGLPVRRSSPEDISDLLTNAFEVRETYLADHIRPDGDTQQYLWTAAHRVA